jgi:tetratricopeptide (TPR) repeat protein
VKLTHRACLVGILWGTLLTSSGTIRSAQDKRIQPLPRTQGVQTPAEAFRPLSDEERADTLMARKLYDQAIEYYQRAIKASARPHEDKHATAVLWNKVGIACQHKMDDRAARKAYQNAIRLDQSFADAWNNLGTVYYFKQKTKKSIKYYRHAIKLNPSAAAYHMNLGTAYFARKKYDDAYPEYRAALELDPNALRDASPLGSQVEARHVDAQYYFYMAKLFASMGRAGEAIRYLQHALEDGFSDEKRILEDPDIQKISKDPAFVTLMRNPPAPIKE